jgi:hypothetical protein
MPRSHARIYLTIWSDTDYLKLPMSAQWLYEALCSQPDINQAGVLSLTAKRWAGLCADGSHKIIQGALRVLEGQRYVVIDEDTEELLVRTFVKNDEVWKQPNTLKNACTSALTTQSAKIRSVLGAELQKLEQVNRDKIESFRAPEGQRPAIVVLRETIAKLGVTPFEGYDDTKGEDIEEPKTDVPKRARAGAGAGVGVRTSPAVGINSRSVGPRSEPRGTRLPDDFVVPDEWLAWARERYPGVNLRVEASRFVNYWHSKAGPDSRKRDWEATWRNWIIKADEMRGSRPGARPAQPPAALPDEPEAAFAELRAKADARTAARLAGLPFVNDVSPPPDFHGDPYAWEREHHRTWLDQHKPEIIGALRRGVRA